MGCPLCHLHVRYPYPANSIARFDLYAHEEIKQTSFGELRLTIICEQSRVVGLRPVIWQETLLRELKHEVTEMEWLSCCCNIFMSEGEAGGVGRMHDP